MQSAAVPLNIPLGDGRGAGMVVVSMPEHPPDYTVWSVASMVYGNPFCLGLIALSFSMKARDRKMVGDLAGATTYGSKARCLNIVALVLIILSIVIPIVVIIATVASAASAARSYGGYGGYSYRGYK